MPRPTLPPRSTRSSARNPPTPSTNTTPPTRSRVDSPLATTSPPKLPTFTPVPDSPTLTNAALETAVKATRDHIVHVLDPAAQCLLLRVQALEPNSFIMVPGGVFAAESVFQQGRRCRWERLPDAMVEKGDRRQLRHVLRDAGREVEWMKRHVGRLKEMVERREAGSLEWRVFWVEERVASRGGVRR